MRISFFKRHGDKLFIFFPWRNRKNSSDNEGEIARNFSILVKGISDCALYMLTPEGHVANWNAGAQRLKGYTQDEILGQPLRVFYTEADRGSGLPVRALETARSIGKYTGEGWRCRKDGTAFWAHVTIERILDSKGRVIGFAKITRDMSRLKEEQDRLAQIRGQLDTALDNMHQGLVLFDAQAHVLLCNRRLPFLWGLEADNISADMSLTNLTERPLGSRHVTDRESIRSELSHALSPTSNTSRIITCSEAFVIAIASRPLPEGGWVSTFEDITERRQNAARIAHMAMHDSLSGLANRSHFSNWCDHELDHAARHALNCAIVAIDLDGFKEINDTWGHSEGDNVIVEVAKRLREACGESGIVARLGGDEFACSRSFGNTTEINSFVDMLHDCFLTPLDDGTKKIPIGASIGVSVFPGDGKNLENLMSNADLAMYRAKKSLTDKICFYQPGMDEAARLKRQTAVDLRKAMENNEFHLVYQSQHSVKTGVRTGYEALLRWNHPTRGAISPVDFIPIAEETGLIGIIGEWVLAEAAKEAATWPKNLKVAVNLSPLQLCRHDLIDSILAILRKTGLPPNRLELEITESAIISDKDRALHVLNQIKRTGISIAMDDFGTGYSSLDTLHSFPFDKIKIDKSFLIQSPSNDRAVAIVRTVLALGQSLNIPVIAEGVETARQHSFLLKKGCDGAQGFYYGAPALVNQKALFSSSSFTNAS